MKTPKGETQECPTRTIAVFTKQDAFLKELKARVLPLMR